MTSVVTDFCGKQLRDYRVLRRLGRGAMAEVYLAEQVSLGRQVALKVLDAELARDPTYVQRFHHEARAAAKLVHASIVQIYEVGQIDGVHFIAQEYVPGRNVGELIKRQGRIEAGLALDIIRQVVAALYKASEQGIVHRDIKPENIMLARSGEVKVADFGLARVQGIDGTNMTQVGVTMGTPLYMSPEQIEGSPLDTRSDIYSLGVTAYHMLSGEPPFQGETALAVAMKHVNQPPEALENKAPDVPSSFARIVHRMMAKKPENRYPDPSSLLRELRTLASEAAMQGWAEGPETWSLAEIIAVADERQAVTEQLRQLMQQSRELSQRRTSGILWAAFAVAFLLLGGAMASFVREKPLLSAEGGSGIARRETAWKQIYQAMESNTPAAWELVWTEFNDFVPQLVARQERAKIFLFRTQDYDAAIEDLDWLANLPESYQAQRNFGFAGLVVAHTNLGEFDNATDANGQLTPEMVDALDPEMREQLERAREQLNPPRAVPPPEQAPADQPPPTDPLDDGLDPTRSTGFLRIHQITGGHERAWQQDVSFAELADARAGGLKPPIL